MQNVCVKFYIIVLCQYIYTYFLKFIHKICMGAYFYYVDMKGGGHNLVYVITHFCSKYVKNSKKVENDMSIMNFVTTHYLCI